MGIFEKSKEENEEAEQKEVKKITPLQLFQNDVMILEKIELLQQKILSGQMYLPRVEKKQKKRLELL